MRSAGRTNITQRVDRSEILAYGGRMSIRRSLQVFFALVVAVVAFGLAQPAGAVENPDYTDSPPPSVVHTDIPEQARPAVSQAQAAALPDRLAITGSDSVQLAVLGAVLLAGGAVVLVARRRVTV